MEEQNSIQSDLQKWLKENKNNLPLRFDTAKVSIAKTIQQSERKISLGKYDSEPKYPQHFYKPITKIVSTSKLNAK